MKILKGIARVKAERRLAKLPPNSGHARRLRAMLGPVEPVAPVVEEVPVAPKKAPAKRKKATTKKSGTDSV